ncbi:hypothetical protein [Streptomyces sp. UNOC14_S4]|uniref:hypothetical protein n=1 Tax=Streptomyces sp. UNOC14_S4 TaxID=2872340 RepID=UPI001E3771E3|nr:hypothetical protein [Streptomyces sp. UNOC14_S4]MCC3770008.1 hypothetical protein [Streptomyces sp. UNOC14_S4]
MSVYPYPELLADLHASPRPLLLAKLGRLASESAADGRLDGVLARLWSGSGEDRILGIELADIARRPALLEQALAEGDTALRLRVLRGRSLPSLDGESVVRAVTDTPFDDRRRLYAHLRRNRWYALGELLHAPVLAAFGEEEAGLLPLPPAGPGVPEPLADALEEEERLLRLRPRTFFALAKADPTRALRLLAEAPHGPYFTYDVSHRNRHVLWEADPDALLTLGRALRGAGPGDIESFARLLGFVRWEDRPALFDAAWGHPPYDHIWPSQAWATVLELLPHERRAREAARLRALAEAEGDEALRRLYTRHLPLAEARAELVALTRGSAPDRQDGCRLLVACAADDRDEHALDTLLPWLAETLHEEEDEVRAAALDALARVRPRHFHAGAVPALDRLVRTALDAPDLSRDTLGALSSLAGTLLAHRVPALADRAVRTLGALWAHPDQEGHCLWRFEPNRVHAAYPALEPALVAAARLGHFRPAAEVAALLKRHGARRPALVALLRTAVRQNEDIADHARTLLARMRTGPVPGEGTVTAERPSRPSVRATADYGRRTADQRERLAERLAAEAAEQRGRWATNRAVAELHALLRTDRALTGHYAHSPHAPVVRAAVMALPHAEDDPEAVLRRLVLEHFGAADAEPGAYSPWGGEAVEAIRRCLRRIRPSRLTTLLPSLLRGLLAPAADVPPPTDRDWKLDALAEWLGPAGATVFADVWRTEGHRPETLRPCLRLSRFWLDDPRVREPAARAVRDHGHSAVHELTSYASDVPRNNRHAYAALLLMAASSDDPTTRRCALRKMTGFRTDHPDVAAALAAAAPPPHHM